MWWYYSKDGTNSGHGNYPSKAECEKANREDRDLLMTEFEQSVYYPMNKVKKSWYEFVFGVNINRDWGRKSQLELPILDNYPNFIYIHKSIIGFGGDNGDILLLSSFNNEWGSIALEIHDITAGCDVTFSTVIAVGSGSKHCEAVIWESPESFMRIQEELQDAY